MSALASNFSLVLLDMRYHPIHLMKCISEDREDREGCDRVSLGY